MYYALMVRQLAKPGADILKICTPDGEHLKHMVGGMFGELAELREGLLLRDKVLMLEESGDFRFYLVGVANWLEMELPTVPVPRLAARFNPVDGLLILTGQLWDLVKRPYVYGKMPTHLVDGQKTPMTEDQFKSSVRDLVLQMHAELCAIIATTGFTEAEVMAHNMQKLCIGPNARYASGVYSDEQATARADKAD